MPTSFLVRVIVAAITKSSNCFYKSTWFLVNMVLLSPIHAFHLMLQRVNMVVLFFNVLPAYYVIVFNVIFSSILFLEPHSVIFF